eukprot:scaffold59049_cov36-Phaeocystis_antarctica.AAC.1
MEDLPPSRPRWREIHPRWMAGAATPRTQHPPAATQPRRRWARPTAASGVSRAATASLLGRPPCSSGAPPPSAPVAPDDAPAHAEMSGFAVDAPSWLGLGLG